MASRYNTNCLSASEVTCHRGAGDSPSESNSSGSTVTQPRRAAQKTSEMTIEESQNADCDMNAGVATTRTDVLALLVPDAQGHRPKERRFLTVLKL